MLGNKITLANPCEEKEYNITISFEKVTHKDMLFILGLFKKIINKYLKYSIKIDNI